MRILTVLFTGPMALAFFIFFSIVLGGLWALQVYLIARKLAPKKTESSLVKTMAVIATIEVIMAPAAAQLWYASQGMSLF